MTQSGQPKKNQPPPLIPGCATPDGTRRYSSRFKGDFAPDFFRQAQGCTLSSIGMGTYLGECDDTEDKRYTETIGLGVASGLNVIDTAINYRCQRSERAVGRAIKAATDSGAASRDELFICTKGGYVPLEGAPPESREEYDRYLSAEYFDDDVMSPPDLVAGGHCIRPKFLADQIRRSRANLGIEQIDLFYLHNPEQQLDALDRKRFLAVIRDAFAELEAQVSRGTISAYGCATWNGFRVPAANKSHLSLGDLLIIAQEVAGTGHHFRFVQLPVNLAMTEAIRLPTQAMNGRDVPFLDCAGNAGVSVVASATLMQSQLAHGLPDAVRSVFPGFRTDSQRAIAFVRSLPVTSSLVGMRSRSHLEENLEAGRTVIRA